MLIQQLLSQSETVSLEAGFTEQINKESHSHLKKISIEVYNVAPC